MVGYVLYNYDPLNNDFCVIQHKHKMPYHMCLFKTCHTTELKGKFLYCAVVTSR